MGPYTIISKIGKGGMAQVFKAIKKGPDGFEKVVALKKILPFYTDHPRFIDMLSTEAKVQSKLDHPNIVQLFDFFQDQDEYLISMEYIEGQNTKQLIQACKQNNIDLPWQACVYICAHILMALDYAHQRSDDQGSLNIIHRDISPHNILMSYDGQVKLSDFGIAQTKLKKDKTHSDVLKGKYRYLSPEQIMHEPLSPQTDLFALGVTLYELLTFQMPFNAEGEFELFQSIIKGTYVPLEDLRPDLPIDLKAAVTMALQSEPGDRFKNAKEFLEDLQSLQDPTWLSFGHEKLSSLMDKAFPAHQRSEQELEQTKAFGPQTTQATEVGGPSLIQSALSSTPSPKYKTLLWALPLTLVMGTLIWLNVKPTLRSKHQTYSTVQPAVTTPSPDTIAETIESATSTDPTSGQPNPDPQKALADDSIITPAKSQNKMPVRKIRKKTKDKKAFGRVFFKGPSGGHIFINGKSIGILPVDNHPMEPGTYLVLMIHEGQRSFNEINVKGDAHTHVHME